MSGSGFRMIDRVIGPEFGIAGPYQSINPTSTELLIQWVCVDKQLDDADVSTMAAHGLREIDRRVIPFDPCTEDDGRVYLSVLFANRSLAMDGNNVVMVS